MSGTARENRLLLVISLWERMWSLGEGGGVSDDFQFTRGFTRAGWKIHFLRPGDRGHEDSEGVVVHTYPAFFRRTQKLPVFLRRLLWPLLFNAVVVPRAMRLARRLRPDFVLGHSHYTTRATWLIRRRLGIPSAVKLFGVMDLVHTEWSRARYAFKNFEQLVALRYPQDAWIVLDDGTRGDEILRRRGIPAERIHFLPNGIDLSWQDRPGDAARARDELSLPAGVPVVLFLARLVASKRPRDVIEAAARVLRDRDARFVFVGDGDLRADCEALARDRGVADRVRFCGSVAHERVPDLMAASDVFVTTSNLTNMALPTCEALVCGLPVVAYDVGDTRRVVQPGKTGILVPDGDVDTLARSLTSLLGDAGMRASMGRSAVQLARETFTGWDERIAMELGIIEGLVGDAGHDGARRPTK